MNHKQLEVTTSSLPAICLDSTSNERRVACVLTQATRPQEDHRVGFEGSAGTFSGNKYVINRPTIRGKLRDWDYIFLPGEGTETTLSAHRQHRPILMNKSQAGTAKRSKLFR